MTEKTYEEQKKEKILMEMRKEHRDRYTCYFGYATGKEELGSIRWEGIEDCTLTLAEIIAAAKKEFPKVPFNRLYLSEMAVDLETEDIIEHYTSFLNDVW